MSLSERRQALDEGLLTFHRLWHPQPFRELRPAWCEEWPVLADELLDLSDEAVAHLNDDGAAALRLLGRHLPEASEIGQLATLPDLPVAALPDFGPHWAWDIPGRKRAQIECFAEAARKSGNPVLDWCGGKGHLGRLLALHWQVKTTSLDIDPVLCSEGEELARRAGVEQDFLAGDALVVDGTPGCHLVALHACGDLHRRAIQAAARWGIAALDVAPCCYYRGVDEAYRPLSTDTRLKLTRDDTRLAVTETVTAAPRHARRRDRDMAWKLGFDAFRRAATGDNSYKSFKPVPPAWFANSFDDFLRRMAGREGLSLPAMLSAGEFESQGWRRQREVMRLSVVRHAFRRPLEIWLALDLAVHLEQAGYQVSLGTFCSRRLTPRNLLLSARRSS